MVHVILLCDMFCNRLQVIRPSGAVLKLNALHGDVITAACWAGWIFRQQQVKHWSLHDCCSRCCCCCCCCCWQVVAATAAAAAVAEVTVAAPPGVLQSHLLQLEAAGHGPLQMSPKGLPGGAGQKKYPLLPAKLLLLHGRPLMLQKLLGDSDMLQD